MGKSKKTKKHYSVIRKDVVRRGLSTSRRLHNQQKTDNYYSSLDLNSYRVQTRKKVRKPIEPEQSSFQSRKINYGAFHAPIDININKEDFICARRKIRREIIFAIGSGGTKVRKPRFTNKSEVKC